MPYGIKINSSNEWFTFNRKYMLLVWNTTKNSQSIMKNNAYAEMPVYRKCMGLTEAKKSKLAHRPDGIVRDGGGKRYSIFLYTMLRTLVLTLNPKTGTLRR